MICFIYATSKNIPPDIWSRIKTYDNTSEVAMYDFDELKLSSNEITRTGFGFFVKVNKKKIVVTCLHIIGKDNIEVDAFSFDRSGNLRKIPLTLMTAIPELDLAFLQFSNIIRDDDFQYFDENHIMKIDAIQKKLKEAKLLFSTRSEYKEIEIRDTEIQLSHLKSRIVPKIPLIKYTCNLEEINGNEDVEGLSGTVIKLGQKIIGMTTSYCNATKKLEAIPMILIYRIIESLKKKSKKITGFYFSTRIIDIEQGSKASTCHMITDPGVIPYKSDTGKEFKFKNDDIITGIDTTEFNNDGTIYNDIIGFNVGLETHVMILSYINTYIKFNIMRKGVEYKQINPRISGHHFDKVYSVNIFDEYKYLYWKGFIFAELSEELIDSLDCSGFTLKGDYFEKYKTIQNDRKKIVVLLDIDYKNLNEKISEKMTSLGAPVVRIKNGYKLLTLEKIGNKRIINLGDLQKFLQENDGHPVTCHYLLGNDDYKLTI